MQSDDDDDAVYPHGCKVAESIQSEKDSRGRRHRATLLVASPTKQQPRGSTAASLAVSAASSRCALAAAPAVSSGYGNLAAR